MLEKKGQKGLKVIHESTRFFSFLKKLKCDLLAPAEGITPPPPLLSSFVSKPPFRRLEGGGAIPSKVAPSTTLKAFLCN